MGEKGHLDQQQTQKSMDFIKKFLPCIELAIYVQILLCSTSLRFVRVWLLFQVHVIFYFFSNRNSTIHISQIESQLTQIKRQQVSSSKDKINNKILLVGRSRLQKSNFIIHQNDKLICILFLFFFLLIVFIGQIWVTWSCHWYRNDTKI